MGSGLMQCDLKDILPRNSSSDPRQVPSSILISSSPGLQSVWRALLMVARTDASVLIQGETGTGKELVASADLFYRLNVYAIPIPPLRERRDDIPLLTAQFIRMLAPRMNKEVREIAEEALERLKRHDWPGNVRELRNFIERAVIHSSGPRLEIPPEEFRADSDAKAATTQTLADAERSHILSVLDQTNGVVSGRNGAALRLGLPRTTLMYRMHKLGIVQKRMVVGDKQTVRSKNLMHRAP